MYINALSNNAGSDLFEKTSNALTDQHKKIIVIASIAISLLLIGYILFKFKCSFKATDETVRATPVDKDKADQVKPIDNPIKPIARPQENPIDNPIKLVDPEYEEYAAEIRRMNIENAVTIFNRGKQVDAKQSLIVDAKDALIRKFVDCFSKQLDPDTVILEDHRRVQFPSTALGSVDELGGCAITRGHIFRFIIESQIYHVSTDEHGHMVFFPELSDQSEPIKLST